MTPFELSDDPNSTLLFTTPLLVALACQIPSFSAEKAFPSCLLLIRLLHGDITRPLLPLTHPTSLSARTGGLMLLTSGHDLIVLLLTSASACSVFLTSVSGVWGGGCRTKRRGGAVVCFWLLYGVRVLAEMCWEVAGEG